jgi:hypothetical protein
MKLFYLRSIERGEPQQQEKKKQRRKDFSPVRFSLIGSDAEREERKCPNQKQMCWFECLFDIDIPVLVLLSDRIVEQAVREHKHLDSVSFERRVPFLPIEIE